ncbi:unnamed protein product [Pleuronectes platessa]|uniref:Uncharacterized protein n=1 Tax=Pleuronectes platessa TaxID=8262 RepID=A0A9N7YV35_PLEPL|nr:unnamed protein product [Pleuronectes platessa]
MEREDGGVEEECEAQPAASIQTGVRAHRRVAPPLALISPRQGARPIRSLRSLLWPFSSEPSAGRRPESSSLTQSQPVTFCKLLFNVMQQLCSLTVRSSMSVSGDAERQPFLPLSDEEEEEEEEGIHTETQRSAPRLCRPPPR